MKKTQGFTLVEIMIVVAIIGILAAIAVPNFIKNRNDSQRRACIANLGQIRTAAENWRAAKSENADQIPDLEDDLVGPSKYIAKAPTCPSGGEYTIAESEAEEDEDGIQYKSIEVTCSKSDDLKHELP